MRAGCFAETRVIRLLNRRFINFYYNTGGPGSGKDAEATKFTKGKTKNVYAFYAAFDANGDPLGVTDIYANKDNTFDFLIAILRANPEFDRFTKDEEKLLTKAKEEPNNPSLQIEAGQLMEDLGRYAEAEKFYSKVLENRKQASFTQLAEVYRAMMRMARYRRDWQVLKNWLSKIEELPADSIQKMNLGTDLAMEKAYLLFSQKKYPEVRKLLEDAIQKEPQSNRLSELHFSAGVACFFLQEKDGAYYHWCWVVENLPDDRLARRCFTAAAHEAMPYENPELGNFAAKLSGGNIQFINAEYERARKIYERMKKE